MCAEKLGTLIIQFPDVTAADFFRQCLTYQVVYASLYFIVHYSMLLRRFALWKLPEAESQLM